MRSSVVVFLMTVLLYSCEKPAEDSQDIPLESFRAEVTATPVKVGQAERKSFDYLIQASGKMEALEQVAVVAERAGFLEWLSVKEGDYVEKGNTIARLDAADAALKLEKAKIQVKNAKANFDSDLLSFETLLKSGDQDKIAQVTDQLKAKTGLYAAEIELKEAERDLEKTAIKAPISGRVADLKPKQGSLVNGGDVLFEIINTSSLELKVKVLESDIEWLSLGQKAEITAIGSSQVLTGSIRSTNPKVDENGLVQVGILVSGAKGLLPGMNARAIIRAPQSNSLVVPKQALVYRSGRPVVFTVEKEESKWNYVEVGKDNGEEVEILSGIEPGSTVITSNNLQLAHQAPVQIVKE
ncbi:efflux RND transporter periplasmic adaptor subunit [Mariniradius saccharolyticus]|uniref:efflux RND transporter periplasmic adaptor subunit n=1 Tax=Mariniradius saccharolyticus TaxID=1245591 RepID=UPI0005915296|nr:efflux RND transporter periplasmic adaptor subunit [Mariniradius saccharolyticus]